MVKNKEYNQAEELSQCLDTLNEGRHPVVADEEIKGLIEVAALVKQSVSQEDVPKLLIDEMVDNLAAELREQKRREHWLYGGLVGTVAAVFIAAFVQFLMPQLSENHIARQIDDSMEKQEMVAVADQSSDPMMVEATNGMIPQQVQSGNSTETPVSAPAEEKSTDPISKVIAEGIHEAELPRIDQKPNQVAILQQETPNAMTTRKSKSMAETGNKSLQENKSMQPERKIAMMMVMPNQAAQSITVDNTSGVIQQVYNLGNNDEIIITQRLLDDESRAKIKEGVNQGEIQELADSAAQQPITKKTKDTMNSLSIKVDKYDITIEGKKTAEELQKIAESLAAKEIEQ
jgi:hypothetical protein